MIGSGMQGDTLSVRRFLESVLGNLKDPRGEGEPRAVWELVEAFAPDLVNGEPPQSEIAHWDHEPAKIWAWGELGLPVHGEIVITRDAS
jgi:hypothetical protein